MFLRALMKKDDDFVGEMEEVLRYTKGVRETEEGILHSSLSRRLMRLMTETTCARAGLVVVERVPRTYSVQS